jgi:hypothetical protein
MKKRLIIVALVTLLLSIMAINAKPNPGTVDGTGNFTGTFGIRNPCVGAPGELLWGPIDINIVVTTNRAPDGNFKVNVHHTSHGLLIGYVQPQAPLTTPTPPTPLTGTEYQISRVGKGQFNAVSTSYVIPWAGEFIGKGSAPNFVAHGELRVFVNAQNEPTGSQLQFTQSTCSQ